MQRWLWCERIASEIKATNLQENTTARTQLFTSNARHLSFLSDDYQSHWNFLTMEVMSDETLIQSTWRLLEMRWSQGPTSTLMPMAPTNYIFRSWRHTQTTGAKEQQAHSASGEWRLSRRKKDVHLSFRESVGKSVIRAFEVHKVGNVSSANRGRRRQAYHFCLIIQGWEAWQWLRLSILGAPWHH